MHRKADIIQACIHMCCVPHHTLFHWSQQNWTMGLPPKGGCRRPLPNMWPLRGKTHTTTDACLQWWHRVLAIHPQGHRPARTNPDHASRPVHVLELCHARSISGLVVEYIVAIDVTRVRFPADAFHQIDARQDNSPVCWETKGRHGAGHEYATGVGRGGGR